MPGRNRKENFSEESAFSTSASLHESAAVAEEYLVQNLQQVDLGDVEAPPKEVLKRWLSIKSVISTASSTAIKQQEAMFDMKEQLFTSIGKGFCGEVFDQVGVGRVLKRAFSPQNNQLWNDYIMHMQIQIALSAAFSQSDTSLELHVPEVFHYYTRESGQWWEQNRHRWPSAALREPTDLLESERILPLPKIIRAALINSYFPSHLRPEALSVPTNRHCLIRVYLGIRRGNVAPMATTLQNFQADLTIIDELQLEKKHHACVMAVALAEMHWTVQVDAADVEFVLGTAPEGLKLKPAEVKALTPRTETTGLLNFKRRSVHVFLLDFNHCRPIVMDEAGVTQAVAAFWQNDPYYPRPHPVGHPDEPLWNAFREQYLDQSTRCLNEAAKQLGLAEKFILGVVAEAKRRANSGDGPPHGRRSSRIGPSH